MNDKQFEFALKEEEYEKKVENKEKQEKPKEKKKIKKSSNVGEEEKKERKEKIEKENEEKKEGKVKEEEKKLKEQKFLNKKKGKKKNKKFQYIGKKKKEEKDDLFGKMEKHFDKKLLDIKDEIEKDDTENKFNLIKIEPISEYVKKKKKEWDNNKFSEIFSMEKFAKDMSIIDFNYNFLKTMIIEDLDKFFQYYKFYQFTLTASQRQIIQKEIKGKCDLPIIKNNFIPDSIKDIKEIFVKLGNSIVDIDICQNDFLEKLKNTFIENHVYSEEQFKSSIPAKFGNRELKINKLIFEIVDFFYKSPMNVEVDNEEEIKLIKDKFRRFNLFKPLFEKIDLYENDEELISVFNYLFNSIYVLFNADSKKRDYSLFNYIILCCLPFELEKAKKFFNDLRMIVNDNEVFIDDIDLGKYDIQSIKAESKVHFKEKDICVYCKDINCNLKSLDFQDFLKGDKFMMCFRFPKLAEINYLYIKDDICKSYHELFKKIMKSKTMKQAINIDKEAGLFEYPFENESILNEIEENCYLVPLPATNYFGISDRAYFSIYINSFINSSTFQNIFIDIDSIIKSKCHELKHIYRIYMNIYNPEIEVKTPEIHYKSPSTNELTKNKYYLFKKKEDIMSEIYTLKCVPTYIIDELDYGDVLEIAINGKKKNIFFFLNSLFCLSEKSWELNNGDFMVNYFKTCFKKKFKFNKNKDNNFINNIINYFEIKTGLTVINTADVNKSSSKGVLNESNNIDTDNIVENNYYYIPKASHFRK